MQTETFDEIEWSIGSLIESSSADEDYEWVFEATSNNEDEVTARAIYYGDNIEDAVFSHIEYEDEEF